MLKASARGINASPTLEAAHSCRDLGISCIPISPGTKNPPKGLKWSQFQTRLATEAELVRWFGRGSLGIAIVLGEVSGGLACRDFDKRRSYTRWAAKHPELAAVLPTVETARGMHVYCRLDLAQVMSASPTGSGGIIVFDDGELRASRAYVLAPPTVHPSRHVYRWTVPMNERPPLLDLFESGLLSHEPCVLQIPTESAEECRECAGAQKSAESAKAILAPGGVGGDGWGFGCEVGDRIEQAIQEAMPSRVGERDKQVFEFCRALKAIEVLADAGTLDLEAIIEEWHRRASPFIGTQPFHVTLTAFVRGWSQVKWPKGESPLDEVFSRAVASKPPKIAERIKHAQLVRLVCFCRELQRSAGEGSFFLASRTAGSFLAAHWTTAADWLRLLTDHYRVLKLVEAADREARKAARYRYLGPLSQE